MATHKLIIAGFGGQGVMMMGQMIAYAGMMDEKHVTWLPAYGPEMRGGTANCSVIVSDQPISSPVISKATCVVAMNYPSLLKFEPVLMPGGLLFINTSLIEKRAHRHDLRVVEVNTNDTAQYLKNDKVSNMVMLGAVLAKTEVVTPKSLYKAMEKVLIGSKSELIPLNKSAIEAGIKIISCFESV